ncbi:MAG: hypothetical protein O2894_07480, partial [Planctomycetota bacterium]|nr:hypothetical protein [Planctomycetota bacterium]
MTRRAHLLGLAICGLLAAAVTLCWQHKPAEAPAPTSTSEPEPAPGPDSEAARQPYTREGRIERHLERMRLTLDHAERRL